MTDRFVAPWDQQPTGSEHYRQLALEAEQKKQTALEAERDRLAADSQHLVEARQAERDGIRNSQLAAQSRFKELLRDNQQAIAENRQSVDQLLDVLDSLVNGLAGVLSSRSSAELTPLFAEFSSTAAAVTASFDHQQRIAGQASQAIRDLHHADLLAITAGGDAEAARKHRFETKSFDMLSDVKSGLALSDALSVGIGRGTNRHNQRIRQALASLLVDTGADFLVGRDLSSAYDMAISRQQHALQR